MSAETLHSETKPVSEITDYNRLDDKFDRSLDGIESEGGMSEEVEEAVSEASNDALNLADRLKLNPDTKVSNSEVNGEMTEVSTTNLPGGDRVEHVLTPEGESTVLSLVDSEGDSLDAITIQHGNPGAILIGDKPVTTVEDAAMVEKVVAQLSNETERAAQTDETAEVSEDETSTDAPEAQEDSAEAVESKSETPEITPEQQEKMHADFVGNVIAPYANALGPDFKSVLDQIGISMDDANALIHSKNLTLDAYTHEAFSRLAKEGARPDSMIWKENPNAPSALGAAARESRTLLAETWARAFGVSRPPKP